MFTRSGLELSALWDKVSHLCEMDDELRGLERASRAGDPAARKRYITALQRVGRHEAALRHLIDSHRDHIAAWRSAQSAGGPDSADKVKQHGSDMWSARRDAHELAERHGLHLADHTTRHSDETEQQFLTRTVHLHEPHGTTFHPHSGGGVVKFDSEHGRTREDVLARRRPRARPHRETAQAFANMWRRETGGEAATHETSDGDFVTGTAVTVRSPSGSSTTRR